MMVKDLIEELNAILDKNCGDCGITVNTNPYYYSFCSIDNIVYDDDIGEVIININITC